MMAAVFLREIREEEPVQVDPGTSDEAVTEMDEHEAKEIMVKLAARTAKARVNKYEEVMVVGKGGLKLMSVGRSSESLKECLCGRKTRYRT